MMESSFIIKMSISSWFGQISKHVAEVYICDTVTSWSVSGYHQCQIVTPSCQPSQSNTDIEIPCPIFDIPRDVMFHQIFTWPWHCRWWAPAPAHQPQHSRSCLWSGGAEPRTSGHDGRYSSPKTENSQLDIVSQGCHLITWPLFVVYQLSQLMIGAGRANR